jgi:cell division transport system permease protein
VQAQAALALLEREDGVESARRVASDEMERLLEPWLGPGGLESDLPIPAMIELDLSPAAYARLDSLRAAVTEVAPAARIDDNAQWLAPLAGLIRSLRLLAGALVMLMIGATAATVVLAARASLDTHRSTIEVLHLMGATDVQVARLFQRRIALDALFGGMVGLIAAALVLLVIGNRVGALGSDLLGSAQLPLLSWAILVALPVFGVALATVVARATILRALGRML